MKIALLDAYNLLFRSFTSLPAAITGGDGKPINAVYGTLAFVLRLSRELEPDRIVAAFDAPEAPTFRRELFDAYQAQREPMGGENAPDFERQVAIAEELLPRIGIPALRRQGYEADDIMGTLAIRAAADDHHVVIVSTDRDLLQLVRPGIEIVAPGKHLTYTSDEADVRARLGVPPEGVTTFKALAGDASDNIPGLPGIGAKTAARLVETYGTLEAIYDHLEDLQPRLAGILSTGRSSAELFRRIATIVTDVELDIDLTHLPAPSITPEDRPRAILDRSGYGAEESPGLEQGEALAPGPLE